MSKQDIEINPGEISDVTLKDGVWNSIPEINSPMAFIVQNQYFGPKALLELADLISDEELEKSRRFRLHQDQKSYIIVHGLLRWILAQQLGVQPRSLRFSIGVNGKPSISGVDNNIAFNLSHSAGVSLLAFDPNHEIGVDVEKIDTRFEFHDIVNQYFSKDEKKYISSFGMESRRRFYEIWTKKEAFLKAIGEGITKNLQVDVLNPQIDSEKIGFTNNFENDFLFKSIIYEQAYQITFALNTHSPEISIFEPEFHINTLTIKNYD